MRPSIKYLLLSLPIVISVLMRAPHLEKDLMSFHVWRQAQTYNTIVNFYEEDMNILNPRQNPRGNGDGIRRMEFPLMQWIGATLFHVLGNSTTVIRLYMLAISILAILGMFSFAKAIFLDEKTALIASWAFSFSPSFYYHGINPMVDNMALCSAIWGLAFFMRWVRSGAVLPLLGSGALLAVAALVKLPFIVSFVFPISFLLFAKKKANRLIALLVVSAGLILPAIWYSWVIPTWHDQGLVGGLFSGRETVGAIFFWIWHALISILPELLLNYGSLLFFVAGIVFFLLDRRSKDPLRIALILWGCALLLYSLYEIPMIQTVHDYYFFPLMPALFLIVAFGARKLVSKKRVFWRTLAIICLLGLPITCHLRNAARWDPGSPGFNKDILTYKNELRDLVPKSSLVVAGADVSDHIYLYYLDKYGWSHLTEDLDPEDLQRMIDSGAEYLYTDASGISNNKDLASFLTEKVGQYGSIQIFRLANSNVPGNDLKSLPTQ